MDLLSKRTCRILSVKQAEIVKRLQFSELTSVETLGFKKAPWSILYCVLNKSNFKAMFHCGNDAEAKYHCSNEMYYKHANGKIASITLLLGTSQQMPKRALKNQSALARVELASSRYFGHMPIFVPSSAFSA